MEGGETAAETLGHGEPVTDSELGFADFSQRVKGAGGLPRSTRSPESANPTGAGRRMTYLERRDFHSRHHRNRISPPNDRAIDNYTPSLADRQPKIRVGRWRLGSNRRVVYVRARIGETVGLGDGPTDEKLSPLAPVYRNLVIPGGGRPHSPLGAETEEGSRVL
jgi:hypothetical protein